MPNSLTSEVEPQDEDWSEIEQLVSGLKVLFDASTSVDDFAGELAARISVLLNADCTLHWKQAGTDDFEVVGASCTQAKSTTGQGSERSGDRTFLQTIVATGEPLQSAIALPSSTRGSSKAMRIGTPISIDGKVVGVLESALIGHPSPAEMEGTERMLAIACELAEGWIRRQQLHELDETNRHWQRYEALSQAAHRSLDLKDTCYQLANDGRLFASADRVSLLSAKGKTFKVVAISGIDTFDARSHLVRTMEGLAESVARTGQWFSYRGTTEKLPPQLEESIVAFTDESHSQVIDVVPLVAPDARPEQPAERLVGVLVIEKFDATTPKDFEKSVTQLANLSSSALSNSIEYETLPLLHLSRWMRGVAAGWTGHRQKLMFALVGLVAATLALAFVPGRFEIEAEGIARPAQRQNVYAPLDAEVVEIRSGHDVEVSEGEVLLRLQSRELEMDFQGLQGEFQTTQKRLLAVASARIQQSKDQQADRLPGQLAAEEQELKQELDNLQRQLKMVREQRDSLSIRSPIDGTVTTWDPTELLEDRPVQRGQLLLSVADLTGPWTLELQVAESRIGHLIDADQVSDVPLDVTFSLVAGSGPELQGKVERISRRSEVLDGLDATTRVRVSVSESDAVALRPGTEVRARIECGTRSIGFIWFHELAETLRSWLWF